MGPYLGELVLLPYSSARPGYVPCDGLLLPVQENAALLALIGTTYGGDGRNDFAVPDYAGAAPQGSTFYLSLFGPAPTEPTSLEPFLGEVMAVPYTFTPSGYSTCEGQMLPVPQNTALYSLIGNTFGGDENEFALPDYRGLAPQGSTYIIALQDICPSQ